MKMSIFGYAPRQDHMDRMKIIYAYQDKMRNSCIQIRTEENNYSALPDHKFDWKYYLYGEIKELLPDDAPTPLGNYVSLTHYVDSSLLHDQLDGNSVTGILHLVYKTPVDWYYKKHSTLDTATYSSEFVSDRTCV